MSGLHVYPILVLHFSVDIQTGHVDVHDPVFPRVLLTSTPCSWDTLCGLKRRLVLRSEVFFCKAQAMIAERRIRLCELLSSGESETTENLAAQLCDSLAWRGSKDFYAVCSPYQIALASPRLCKHGISVSFDKPGGSGFSYLAWMSNAWSWSIRFK